MGGGFAFKSLDAAFGDFINGRGVWLFLAACLDYFDDVPQHLTALKSDWF